MQPEGVEILIDDIAKVVVETLILGVCAIAGT